MDYLNVSAEKCIKSLLFKVDEDYVLILVRGDHEVNDIKVKNLLAANDVELADAEETKSVIGCEIGSIGPVHTNVRIIADHAVSAIVNGVCGANEAGYHYVNVNVDRDFTVEQYADVRFIQEGDPSPDGEGSILFAKGIEVGHIFKLGTRYSEAMDATILDENGRSQPMIMGCYGIGVSRVMAAIAEQHSDENGLVWPENIAPYQLHLVSLNMKKEDQVQLSERVYDSLKDLGYRILWDDRAERAGVKFADSDLIGLPLRITVGKKANEGIVEVKLRSTGEQFEVSVDELPQFIHNQLA